MAACDFLWLKPTHRFGLAPSNTLCSDKLLCVSHQTWQSITWPTPFWPWSTGNSGLSTSPSPTPAQSSCSHSKTVTQHWSTRYFNSRKKYYSIPDVEASKWFKCCLQIVMWCERGQTRHHFVLLPPPPSVRLTGVPALPCLARCWRWRSRMTTAWSCSPPQRCQVEKERERIWDSS